jgi:hypothetical protein
MKAKVFFGNVIARNVNGKCTCEPCFYIGDSVDEASGWAARTVREKPEYSGPNWFGFDTIMREVPAKYIDDIKNFC